MCPGIYYYPEFQCAFIVLVAVEPPFSVNLWNSILKPSTLTALKEATTKHMNMNVISVRNMRHGYEMFTRTYIVN